jgi:hypothetical protein
VKLRRFAILLLIAVGLTLLLSAAALCSVAEPTAYDCTAVTEITVQECQGLVTLYNSTDGPNWLVKDNWLVTDTPCDWHGVTCYENRVMELVLASNQLSGTIPSTMGNLTGTVLLIMDHNQLTGSIPPELGNLTLLRWLHLNHNQLEGSIPPELGSLGDLIALDLSFNRLGGAIPPQLGALTNLARLDLTSNQITGTIPSELGGMTSMERLILTSNQLEGSIPPELGSLPALEWLKLEYNQLTGSIPPQLGEYPAPMLLKLNGNKLSGPIPPQLGNVWWLHLPDNQLSGLVPPGLATPNRLRTLHIEGNPLWGALPMELTDLTLLGSLYFHDTQLCEPDDPVFQAWLAGVGDMQSTDVLCAPPSGVTITGPVLGTVGVSSTFTATATPVTATLPITYGWQASGQAPVTYTVGLTSALDFTWAAVGMRNITVTARNSEGQVAGSHAITIEELAVPAVTIRVEGNALVLRWDAITGAVLYNVYRDSEPYFAPLFGTPHATTPHSGYPDTEPLADPSSFYYVVTAVTASGHESSPSGRVGKFEFSLVPGDS